MKPFINTFLLLLLLFAIYLLFFSCSQIKGTSARAYPQVTVPVDSNFIRIPLDDTARYNYSYLMNINNLPDSVFASKSYYRWKKLYKKTIAY